MEKKYNEDFNEPFQTSSNGNNKGHATRQLKRAVAYPGQSDDFWEALGEGPRPRIHEFDARDPNRDRKVFPTDDKGSPAIVIFLMIGMVMGCASVVIAILMGLKLLPIIAVYCSVGSAATLATAVVFALLNTDTIGSE